MSSNQTADPPAIAITNLCKTYQNGRVALRGIDLQVPSGDFFALLGPNGAGKSTVIGIITSLVNSNSGSVKVYGYDTQTHFNEAKSCIGVLPQEFNFNAWEPVEEILINQAGYYGVKRCDAAKRARYWLNRLDLWDRRAEIARHLSGGMKRRMMVARALMHNPRLLILDEPTAGVDIENRRTMWHFLTWLNQQGTTIILTTHYLEEAENLCRHIAIIDQGQVIEYTSVQALINRIDQQTLILDLKNETTQLPTLNAGYSSRLLDGKTIEVNIKAKTGVSRLFQELSQAGLEVQGMRNKTSRLEQLFFKLTDNDKPS